MINAFDNELLKVAEEDARVIIIGADDGRFRSMVSEKMKKRYYP